VEVDAFAKINLFLDVLGHRSDGYHELAMVMVRVGLKDTVRVSSVIANDVNQCRTDSRFESDWSTVTLTTNAPHIPTDDSNLCVKAAKLLAAHYGIPPVHITLTKHIPMGAGLGGGSSDCAATLLAIDKFFRLDIPELKLMEMGKTLGADVPFCIFANMHGTSGAAVATGIGEKLSPLPAMPMCHIVLACPDAHVSTAEVFGELAVIKQRQPIALFTQAYNAQDISQVAHRLYNVFTPITAMRFPIVSRLIEDFCNHGALGASMTGTGATVFAIFDDGNTALRAKEHLQKEHSHTMFFM